MKKVLLITAQFAPDPAVGAMRASAFAERLPDLGWQACVLARRNDSGAASVPEPTPQSGPAGIRVDRVWGGDSKRLFGIGGRYPALAALPDRHVSWLPAAVVRGNRLIRDESVDVILSSGPPSTAHCIGLLLRRFSGLPWVADLRDPWRTIEHGRVHSAIDRRIEAAVMRGADRIVASTDGIAAELQARLGDSIDTKTSVIPNGFDETLFAGLGPAPAESRFWLLHAGSITGYRDAGPLLTALRESLRAATLPADTGLVFLGGGDSDACAALERQATQLGLAANVRFEPRRSQREALAAICRAPVLVLLQSGPETDPCIPTKAFEYLRSNGLIVSLARRGSQTQRLMEGWDGVFSADADSVPAVRARIESAFAAWQDQARPQRDVERYSRRHTTAELAALLDRMTAAGPRP